MHRQVSLRIKLHVDNPTPLGWYPWPPTLDGDGTLHGHVFYAAFEAHLICDVNHLIVVIMLYGFLHPAF